MSSRSRALRAGHRGENDIGDAVAFSMIPYLGALPAWR